jgi:hypothetical protein
MSVKTESKTVKLSTLKPHSKNPRMHSEEQLSVIKQSLEAYGQYRQIVVDEKNVILAGHGLWQSMMEMDMETARVYRMTGLSEKDKNRLLLVDNRSQSMGWDDYDQITALIKEIDSTSIPGFNEDVLQAILDEGQEAIDEAIAQADERVFGRSANGEGEGFFSAGSTESNSTAGRVETREADGQVRKVVVCPDCGKEIWLE